MFELTILSIFRESESYLQRYFQQVRAAFRAQEGACHAVWLEGDSIDRTFHLLEEEKSYLESLGHQVTLIKFNTEGPLWNSSRQALDRWKQLAACWNGCMEELLPTKIAVCVESDLIWSPDIIQRLAAKLDERHHVIYPMLMFEKSLRKQGQPLFYDKWGFSRGGSKFRARFPYWQSDKELIEEKELLQISTGGGMIVSTFDYQRQGHWDEKSCIRLFPRGVKLFMDKTEVIFHPHPPHWSKITLIRAFLNKFKVFFRYGKVYFSYKF